MEDDFETETERIRELPSTAELELEAVLIRPRKADIKVSRLILAWVP
jgi:hypothetical protein